MHRSWIVILPLSTAKSFYDEYMARMENLRDRLLEVLDVVKQESRFGPSGIPVTESIVDGYFEKIKRPMDFCGME
jgi:hypothetical protein